MEDLLGIDTWFVFLVQKTRQSAETHRVVTWKDVFASLDLSRVPHFMAEAYLRLVAEIDDSEEKRRFLNAVVGPDRDNDTASLAFSSWIT